MAARFLIQPHLAEKNPLRIRHGYIALGALAGMSLIQHEAGDLGQINHACIVRGYTALRKYERIPAHRHRESGSRAVGREVIVASGMGTQHHPGSTTGRRAAKSDKLLFIPADWINRATPLLLQGAERLCGILDGARKGNGAN